MVGMHYILEVFTVKIRADCMLHGSQKHSAHTKLQRFERLTQPRRVIVNWIGLLRSNFSKNRIILSIIKIVYLINVVL